MIKGNLFYGFRAVFPRFPGQGELPWQNANRNTATTPSPSLEGADRVRKRPGVIFGSDGLEGCEHAVFEILSNAIDEAREGYGRVIIRHPLPGRQHPGGGLRPGLPGGLEREGRQRYNWELVFCELYAGGKYDNAAGDNYEYSLGLNGLGACATQYASALSWTSPSAGTASEYDLHFEKGETRGGDCKVAPADRKKTGTTITLAARPGGLYPDRHPCGVLHRRPAPPGGGERRHHLPVPGPGGDGLCRDRTLPTKTASPTTWRSWPGTTPHTPVQFWSGGADRAGTGADKPDYKVKLSCAFCFCQRHRISWSTTTTPPGWSTAAPRRRPCASAFVSAMDEYLKQNGKYNKNESQDHLAGRAGLPDLRLQQLLHPDLL